MAFNEEPPNNTNSSQEQSQENNIHNQDKYENVSNNESTQNDDSNSSNKGKYWLIGCGAGCGCLVILIILVLAACVIFMKVSDSISSSDSENATHESKQEGNSRKAGGNDKEEALQRAETYAKSMYMSKKGIYNQLTSSSGDKFNSSTAKYAVNHLKDVDYKENALKTAEESSDNLHFSKKELTDYLKNDENSGQFTSEQVDYAMKHAKIDYKENALETAKHISDQSYSSKSQLEDELTSKDGRQFTKDEADYAMKHLKTDFKKNALKMPNDICKTLSNQKVNFIIS